jgi:hypothetical protein
VGAAPWHRVGWGDGGTGNPPPPPQLLVVIQPGGWRVPLLCAQQGPWECLPEEEEGIKLGDPGQEFATVPGRMGSSHGGELERPVQGREVPSGSLQ